MLVCFPYNNSIHIYINIDILRNKHNFFIVFLSVINCIFCSWCQLSVLDKSNDSIWIFNNRFISDKEMFDVIFFSIFKLTFNTIRVVWIVIGWKFSIFYTKFKCIFFCIFICTKLSPTTNYFYKLTMFFFEFINKFFYL